MAFLRYCMLVAPTFLLLLISASKYSSLLLSVLSIISSWLDSLFYSSGTVSTFILFSSFNWVSICLFIDSHLCLPLGELVILCFNCWKADWCAVIFRCLNSPDWRTLKVELEELILYGLSFLVPFEVGYFFIFLNLNILN